MGFGLGFGFGFGLGGAAVGEEAERGERGRVREHEGRLAPRRIAPARDEGGRLDEEHAAEQRGRALAVRGRAEREQRDAAREARRPWSG